MKTAILAAAFIVATGALASPGAHGPNGEHLEAKAVAASNALARLPDGSVSVPMLAQRRLAVRTLLAQETNASASVELPGRVVMDPNAGGRIQTLSGGKVQPGPGGLPVAGQKVRKGDLLGLVVDRKGDTLEEIRAGVDGWVVSLKVRPQVAKGEPVVGLAVADER